MAVKARRGLEANRGAVTFGDGEIVYTTDQKKVYIGDGSTAGGVRISAGDADTLGGNSSAAFAKLASGETITGAWTFSNATPTTTWVETGAAANNKIWRVKTSAEQYIIEAVNDAYTVATPFIQVDRTGTTIDTVNFPNGTLQSGGVAVVKSSGALGTPTSGVLTNCTGLPTAGLLDDAVTYAKMQNVSATDRLLGRSTAGAGNVEEIVCTAAARAILDDTTGDAMMATIGGAAHTGSGGYARATNPTFAAITNNGNLDFSGTNRRINGNQASSALEIWSNTGASGAGAVFYGGSSGNPYSMYFYTNSTAVFSWYDAGSVFATVGNVRVEGGLLQVGSDAGVWTRYGYDGGQQPSDGQIEVIGDMTTSGTKYFSIPHPLPELHDTHKLNYVCTESSRADLTYRGRVKLVDGKATVNLDTEARQTEGTFMALVRDDEADLYAQNRTGFARVLPTLEGNLLTLTCEDPNNTDTFSWLVMVERSKDEGIQNSAYMGDDGRLLVEPLVKDPRVLAKQEVIRAKNNLRAAAADANSTTAARVAADRYAADMIAESQTLV